MLKFIAKFQSKLQGEDGATAVEYGLMVALIAGAIILVVTALGHQLATVFSTVTTAISAI